MPHPYKVTKQYTRGAETTCATFEEKPDSLVYIDAMLANDGALNVKVTYRLYDLGEVIQTFTPDDQNKTSGVQSSGGQDKSGGSPSPFSTSPKPPGTPTSWNNNSDDDK